jgi:hypothetical protein
MRRALLALGRILAAIDGPANLPVRQINGLSATPNDRGSAHIGTNPAARDDALACAGISQR